MNDSLKLTTLGEVCEFIRGITFKPLDVTRKESIDVIACFRTKNIQEELDLHDLLYLPSRYVTNSRQYVRAGDILISTANSKEVVGKCCFVEELSFTATLGGFIAAARPDSTKVHPRYLYFWMNSPSVQAILRRTARQTTNIANLPLSHVEKMQFPLASLPEQARIVRILNEADEIRRLRVRADSRTADLIPAIFYEMFVKDEDYPPRKLSEVCEFITKGTTPHASEIKEIRDSDDVPYLKVYHITDRGDIDFERNPSFVSNALHQGLLNRSKVYPRDVLMNIVGPPLGKIGIVPSTYPEWNINQALAIFRATDQIEPTYLLHALRSSTVLPGILNQAVGIRQLNISLQQCRDTVIPVPPLPLQRKFADHVAEVRALEERQGASRERLDELFQSLLHHAFRGEL